jgi:hypothetical protein
MLRLHRSFGVALVGAGLIAAPALVPASSDVQARAVRLIDNADSPLGDGTAFILGGSGPKRPVRHMRMRSTRSIWRHVTSPAQRRS